MFRERSVVAAMLTLCAFVIIMALIVVVTPAAFAIPGGTPTQEAPIGGLLFGEQFNSCPGGYVDIQEYVDTYISAVATPFMADVNPIKLLAFYENFTDAPDCIKRYVVPIEVSLEENQTATQAFIDLQMVLSQMETCEGECAQELYDERNRLATLFQDSINRLNATSMYVAGAISQLALQHGFDYVPPVFRDTTQAESLS